MHSTTLLLSAIATMALASPIDNKRMVWKPVDTVTTCDSASNQYIPAVADSTLVEGVCRKFMPCAFPTEGVFCTMVLQHTLNGTQSTILLDTEVLVEGEANILPNSWKAQLTVTPSKPTQPSSGGLSTGIMWTAGDCVGYFTQLLSKSAPNGCMSTDLGAGAGKLTVGGDESLKGTVFALSFVDSQ